MDHHSSLEEGRHRMEWGGKSCTSC